MQLGLKYRALQVISSITALTLSSCNLHTSELQTENVHLCPNNVNPLSRQNIIGYLAHFEYTNFQLMDCPELTFQVDQVPASGYSELFSEMKMLTSDKALLVKLTGVFYEENGFKRLSVNRVERLDVVSLPK